MRYILRLTALTLLLMLALSCTALAAATPTPPPQQIMEMPVQPPRMIQDVLDIAYAEWEALDGKTLSRTNKFTEWRGKGVSFGWCAGYVTWCMMEAGVPMYELEHFLDESNDTAEGFYPASGVIHTQEAGVPKLLRAYQRMNRTTMIPQPGFILVYGCSYNKTIHVGLVYDVEPLGEGQYRITTLEGNMSNRVKMYIHDYDMNAEVNTNNRKSTNLFEVPESERMLKESDALDYSVPSAKPSSSAANKYAYYVHCFLMPWVPGDPALPTPEPTATPAPTPTPTAEPTATPAPTPTPTAEPTATPAPTPTPTAEPTATPTPTPTAEPTATPAPTPTPTAEPTATPAPLPQLTAVPPMDPNATPVPTPEPETVLDRLGDALSQHPTPAPTPEATPTVAPTATPTATPTAAPTATPTATPTVAPTATPTATPTAAPTATPTATPTAAPTATPTATPTAAPTATPAPTPTVEPEAATYPCTGKDGGCSYITYDAEDPFCRACDRNENGVEDVFE